MDIPSLVDFISISNETGEDLFQWTRNGASPSNYRLDIIAVKAMIKTEGIYYQIERHELKICFIMSNSIIIIIGAQTSVQYQLLEAIIDEVSEKFLSFYGDMIRQFSGSFSDAFNGFSIYISEIIENIYQKITYVKAICKACKYTHQVCIKNSLISNTKDFPVSIVYIHEGHGLLIYIDASFKVRGTEIVNITG